jgi:hypothetical protein
VTFSFLFLPGMRAIEQEPLATEIAEPRETITHPRAADTGT